MHPATWKPDFQGGHWNAANRELIAKTNKPLYNCTFTKLQFSVRSIFWKTFLSFFWCSYTNVMFIKYLYTQKFKSSPNKEKFVHNITLFSEKNEQKVHKTKRYQLYQLYICPWTAENYAMQEKQSNCVYCKLWIWTQKQVNLIGSYPVICFKHWFTTSGK